MNNINSIRLKKETLSSTLSHSEWVGDALLNVAKMYCKVGNYQQAIEWCETFLLTNKKNEQLTSILADIARQARSFGVKKQAQRLLLV